MHSLRVAGILVLTLLSASVSESEVCACAPAMRGGEAVHIAEESAIIVWDAASKTQHFIRRASFETKARDFGFLVPTPSVPELAESDNSAFRFLEEITSPLREQIAAAAPAPAPEAPKSAPPRVVVVATAKVGGYDAAVLDANDAGALDRWLKEHEYVSNPPLVAWYTPYIQRGWKITAFKIAGGAQGDRVNPAAVRMSFRTDKPFFPYREPADPQAAKGGDRQLQLYFVGDTRPEGRIGESGSWPGRATWSGPLSTWQREELARLLKVPAAQAGPMTRLTAFRDSSSPRPGTDDLYFTPAADQSGINASVDGLPGRGTGFWDDPTTAWVTLLLVLAGLYAATRWFRRRMRETG